MKKYDQPKTWVRATAAIPTFILRVTKEWSCFLRNRGHQWVEADPGAPDQHARCSKCGAKRPFDPFDGY